MLIKHHPYNGIDPNNYASKPTERQNSANEFANVLATASGTNSADDETAAVTAAFTLSTSGTPAGVAGRIQSLNTSIPQAMKALDFDGDGQLSLNDMLNDLAKAKSLGMKLPE